jgi:hypothetical protein
MHGGGGVQTSDRNRQPIKTSLWDYKVLLIDSSGPNSSLKTTKDHKTSTTFQSLFKKEFATQTDDHLIIESLSNISMRP